MPLGQRDAMGPVSASEAFLPEAEDSQAARPAVNGGAPGPAASGSGQGPAAGGHETPAPAASGKLLALRPRPVAGAWMLGAAAAFGCYLLLARTRAVNSDGASQALQAWDMLHGNLLLRGWLLSDVSFYTTELPQYMLVELARGLNAGVVDVAAAMTSRWRCCWPRCWPRAPPSGGRRWPGC